MTAVAIAAIPVPMSDSYEVLSEFDLDIVAPATVRAIGFRPERAKLTLAGGRDQFERVLLFVECEPGKEKRRCSFVLQPTNEPLSPKHGYRAIWRATGMSPFTGAVVHLFELELDIAALARPRNPLIVEPADEEPSAS